MEVEPKLQEPQLSGAYIRSLVKQLSSSRTKDPMKSKSTDVASAGEFSQEIVKDDERLGDTQQQQSPPSSMKALLRKKQVRRRLRTSRPYQERLLNMAEARREIVTALKLHRATMKQANEQQQQQQQQQQQNPSPSPTLELSPAVLEELQQEMNEYRRNSRIYTPNYTFPNYAHNTKLSPFTYPSFSWIYPPITRLSVSDDLNSPFPNQPLGLNLNLQSFNNNDESFCNNLSRKPSIQPSSCSNSPATIMSSIKIPCISNISCQASGVPLDPAPVSLHPMMDDDEIAEIRLIGEQHDMEWNDKMNLMTSAWWSKYLKNMEDGLCEKEDPDEAGFQMFDEVFNMPSWLSNEGDAKESCLFQPHMNSDYNEDAYMHDSAFPW
ncbi:hypothetical protein OPV22_011756 [Ensete ventricosum]|uniref:BZIP domain-containing protein n=1 Tax=Ensete ventricosum TaxID=4639 RepID=A0AAV8PZL9_ENSVE|nr:hypothetical protein OPV22_011756 [Ensete ventricosum]